jgi:type IV pilus assembly protein PilV
LAALAVKRLISRDGRLPKAPLPRAIFITITGMKSHPLLLPARLSGRNVNPSHGLSNRFAGKSGGFSLLEVLISIIVLSFGLLGMVGMQAAALQANKEARYQSVGVRMASELAETMRSNQYVAIKTTAADNPYLLNFVSGNDIAGITSTNCFTGDCYSGADPVAARKVISQFEVKDWLTRLNTELPGAKVVVCFDNKPYDASGNPQWACDSTGATATVAIIKIGWTRGSTNRASTGAAAFENASVPSVVLPVTPGSAT